MTYASACIGGGGIASAGRRRATRFAREAGFAVGAHGFVARRVRAPRHRRKIHGKVLHRVKQGSDPARVVFDALVESVSEGSAERRGGERRTHNRGDLLEFELAAGEGGEAALDRAGVLLALARLGGGDALGGPAGFGAVLLGGGGALGSLLGANTLAIVRHGRGGGRRGGRGGARAARTDRAARAVARGAFAGRRPGRASSSSLPSSSLTSPRRRRDPRGASAGAGSAGAAPGPRCRCR